jgi:thiol-disulfide isomerase/thioredoxin
MSLRPTVVVALLLAVLLPGLTACSGLPESGDKGYTTGEGTVTQLAVDDRESPVTLRADDLDGNDISLADYRGKPLVIVVWGAWCVECRAEQSEVNRAAEELAGTARFVGIDVRDNVAAAQQYEREKDVAYPSIDGNDGQALKAFAGTLAPYTVPAFVVLDAEGRVAASIIGTLPSRLTLVDVVEEVASGAMGDADG